MSTPKTVSELAKRYHVSQSTIRNNILSGELTARNITPNGKRPTYRIEEADAKRWWDSLKVSGAGRKLRAKQTKPINGVNGLRFSDFA